MSAPVDVRAVMGADLRYTRKRLADARRKADDGAARAGARIQGADFHAEWVEHVLQHKVNARAAVAELIDYVRSDRCFCHGEFVCTRCLVLRRVGAAS